MMKVSAVLGLVAVVENVSAVTPVQKVIQMMNDLVLKADKDMKAEDVAQSTYQQWCEDTDQRKGKAIAAAEEQMDSLNADIQQYTVDIERLSDEIAGLEKDIADSSGDQKAATEVRAKEASDFKATQIDYQESISAIERATAELKKRSADHKQADSFVQKVASLSRVPPHSRRVLRAFLQTGSPDDTTQLATISPEANAYEFQSGGVVEMLEKLGDKFGAELTSLEKEELTTKHAYEQLSQELTDAIERATSAKDRKTKKRAQNQKALATARGDLAETTQSRDDDAQYKSDLGKMCTQKATDFASRQKLRSEELVALKKAIEIIEGEVSPIGEKHLPQLVQRSFLQLNSKSSTLSPQQTRALQYLQAMAKRLGSQSLAQLSQHVADPFTKIRKMIKNMIQNLKEEALAESEHHGWCTAELAGNKETREYKTSDVADLTARKEDYEATLAKTAQATADLKAQVSQLSKDMAEATEQRAAEKAKNAEAVADAKVAQEAVMRALTILRDFYEKAGKATAFLQGPADDAPETFTSSFNAQQGSSGGIVGMVEVIHSDFARLESDTTVAEKQAEAEYQTFMQDSRVDVATKETQVEMNNEKSARLSSELATTKKDLQSTQEELDAANAYYEKLKPTCVTAPVSYEERVQRREEEIQSLKEALDILAGTEIDMS